jgi:ABC-type molybdate transport system substrate-binding protein
MRRGSIAKPWLIILVSLVVIVGLAGGLWQMSRPPRVAGQDQDLVLLCAAGPLKAVQEICAEYEREYGVKVSIEPDNSGRLLSRLRAAPERADLYLASDESFVRDAKREKLVAEVLPVVGQHAVVAVAKGNPRKIHALDDLLRDDVRVVLPNAKVTAVAESVERALSGTGRWQTLLDRQGAAGSRVSSVGTVTEAAQAVKIGAADASFVWDATARQFEIEIVELPELQTRTREQVVLGVVAASSRPTAALQLARYLTARDRGEKVFQKYFYEVLPDADVWEPRPALTLMAGAMLRPGIDDLVKSFQAREGVQINTIYDGCGVLVAQMKAMRSGQAGPSARFPDAYFSCDVSFMNKVQQWFEASTVISRNDMVLCVPKGNPKKVKSIEDLARPDLRIGLGHPEKSALGALTDDLLKKLLLHDKVYGAARKTPILQTSAGDMLINQLLTGALDVIVVYRSNVVSNQKNADEHLDIVEMNLKDAMAIQPFAVAKETQHPYLMRRLLAAILAPESQERFRRKGFHWMAEGTSP